MQSRKRAWVVVATALALLWTGPTLATGGGNGDLAYTVWMIVFNNPGGCISEGGCGEEDVFENPFPGEVCIAYFAGGRVQSNRRAAFGASYEKGGKMGTLFCFSDTGETLEDPATAELHFILRTHERYLPEIAHEQITTVDGGCDVQTCDDTQAAVFLPDGLVQTTDVFNFSNGDVKGWAKLERTPGGVRASFHTRVPRR
jgi:hypothetical protein